MKKVDFLFIYESKVRELESVCLLKYELERRGYRTAVLNTWYCIDHKFKNYDAEVVITHALMNDGVYDFIKYYAGNIKKLVNMQCEQIGTNADKTENSRFIYTGMAKKCVHIAWGLNTFERLFNQSHIKEENIKLTGQIALDFCRPEFEHYYKKREELLKEYHLSKYETINLFISSFSYVNLPENLYEQSNINNKKEFAEISIKSQDIILNWIIKLLFQYPSQLFIYRPHPAEAHNQKLIKLEHDFVNFRVINEYSVKQWIKISDQIYTWYSTSIVEVFACGKICSILRPIEIPYSFEIEIYNGARLITSFDDFEASLTKKESFPINIDLINRYYYIDQKEAAYIKIANELENVYNNDSYIIVDERKVKNAKSIKQVVKERICRVAIILLKRSRIKNRWAQSFIDKHVENVDGYTKELQMKNYASEEEINDIVHRIKLLLKNES